MIAINQIQAYVDNLINVIDDIPDCRTLNKLETEVFAELNTIIQQVVAQRIKLEISAIIPVDLVTAIIWITNWINNNVIIPLEQVIALEQLVVKDLARLEEAITTKYQHLQCKFIPLGGIVYNIGVSGDLQSGTLTVGGGAGLRGGGVTS